MPANPVMFTPGVPHSLPPDVSGTLDKQLGMPLIPKSLGEVPPAPYGAGGTSQSGGEHVGPSDSGRIITGALRPLTGRPDDKVVIQRAAGLAVEHSENMVRLRRIEVDARVDSVDRTVKWRTKVQFVCPNTLDHGASGPYG